MSVYRNHEWNQFGTFLKDVMKLGLLSMTVSNLLKWGSRHKDSDVIVEDGEVKEEGDPVVLDQTDGKVKCLTASSAKMSCYES